MDKSELLEIENQCLMFQYATQDQMATVQRNLSIIFKPNIKTRQELLQQLALCLELLYSSKREIVHSVVSSHLKVLLTTKHHLFTKEDLVNLQSNFGGELTQLHGNRFILSLFIQIHALISVLGWLDLEQFPQRYNDMLNDAESPTPSPYSLPSLSALVQEMNPDTTSIKNYGRIRKTASAFKDSHLKTLVQSAFKFYSQNINNPNATTEMALDLIISCLSFDFLGTMRLTSSSQFPANFKSWILEEQPLEQLFEGIRTCPAKHQKIIEAMTWICGCRRSLFMEDERISFFKTCCDMISNMLEIPFEDEVKTELLKLIVKFTNIYQNDFKKHESSIKLLQTFTIFSQNIIKSITPTDYLFIIMSWVNLRDSEHQFFLENLEGIKLLMASLIDLSPDMLDSLYFEDENIVEQVLPHLGKILRNLSTQFTSQLIISRLNRHGQNTSGLGMINTAWTLSIYSSSMEKRVSYQAETIDDTNDGQVCSQIFNFISQKPIFTNTSDKCEEILEVSIIGFFEQFKHAFLVGDGSSCPALWETVCNNTNLKSQEHVIMLTLQRILQYFKDQPTEKLVMRSIDMFKELVNGVRSCKLLQTPEVMGYLESSGILSFQFVTSFQRSKCLSVLFEMLGKLFLSELFNNQAEPNLYKLLTPIDIYIREYENRMNDGSQMDLIIRKLRGILCAIYSSKLFKLLFDWVKQHIQTFAYFLNSPACVNGPVNTLKFVRDLVSNKYNRLTFDINQEYGILVFREAMSIVVPIIVKLKDELSQDPPENVWVKQYLKPITVLIDTFKNTINSRSVPFGILLLYGDKSLSEMIQSVYLISSFISKSQLIQYPKLGKAYFDLWVLMSSDYNQYLCANLESVLFNQIMENVYEIIENLDNSTSSQACTLLYSIYAEIINNKRFFNVDPGLVHRSMIPLLLFRLLGSDVYIETQWSMTRPLYPMVLYDVEWFQAYISHLVQIQSKSHEQLEKILFGLLSGIDDMTLSSRNRDRFTANLESVKRNLRSESLSLEFGPLEFFK